MSDQSQESGRSASGKKVLGILALGALIYVGVKMGTSDRSEGSKSVPKPAAQAVPVGSSPSTHWGARQVGDLTLDAPYAFGPGASMLANLPATTREVVDGYEVFESDSANPHAKVSLISFKPGTELDLSRAMDGAMRAVAISAGDANPQFHPTLATIDGLPSCRASYSGSANGKALHVDARFVQSGQKMWQAQIISIGSSSESDTKRVLDSIQVRK